MAQLSPFNASGLKARQEGLFGDLTAIEPERRWQCMACYGTHRSPRNAEACCPPEVEEVWVNPGSDEVFDSRSEAEDALGRSSPDACPVCGTSCEDAYEAASCCLWRDLAPATRFQIASAVQRGTPWVDAIAAASS